MGREAAKNDKVGVALRLSLSADFFPGSFSSLRVGRGSSGRFELPLLASLHMQWYRHTLYHSRTLRTAVALISVALAVLVGACSSEPPRPAPPVEGPIERADQSAIPKARSRKLVVWLDIQAFQYIEDGMVVRTGAVSSGTPAHPTPKGRFAVLSKNKDKVSSKYTNAFDFSTPMPYAMQFHGNYFIHEGWVPWYADSHGCVRLRYEDAKFLFDRMKVGDPVVVTD
jgi:lipoprotein-anchoring transpeptidase ErfK/SrfK